MLGAAIAGSGSQEREHHGSRQPSRSHGPRRSTCARHERCARRAHPGRDRPRRLQLTGAVHRGGLPAGRPRRPLGGAGLGRDAALPHPPGRAGPDRPRPQPLPRLGGDVGRLGGLRLHGERLLRHRQAAGGRRRCRAGGGHQLRGLPDPPLALRDRRRPGRRPGRARRGHGVPLLPDGLRGDRGRLPGRARQPDRGSHPGVRPDRRLARGAALRRHVAPAREPPAGGRRAGHGHARPGPLAAPLAGEADRPERPADPRQGPGLHRSALGPRDVVRPAGVGGRHPHRPRTAAAPRRPGHRRRLPGGRRRGDPPLHRA